MQRLALLGLAAACIPSCSQDCPAGSHREDDGLCHLDEIVADSGENTSPLDDTSRPETPSEDSGKPKDTEVPIDWQTLPVGCSAQGSSDDPVTLVSKLHVQTYSFVELIDIEVIAEDNLVVAAGQGGLIMMDVSDETSPSYLTAVGPDRFHQRFYRLEVGPGDAIYATHRDHGMAIYDRSDPSSPTEVRLIEGENFSGMASTDTHLYLATHAGELIAYDLSEPFAPAERDRISGLGNPWEPHLLGDRLYVADNTSGIVVIDLSDPDHPSLIGAVEAAGGVQDIAFSGDGTTLYAAVGGAGVEAFTLDDPDEPISMGLVNVNYSVISVAVDGDRLWAADQQDLVAFDITIPASPVLINTEQTEQWAMHVAAASDRAYVADWAYLALYQTDIDRTAPDLSPASTALYVTAAAQTVLELDNLGNAPLRLLGAEVPSGDIIVEFSSDTIDVGETAQMGITYTGSSAEQVTVCVATNDPDEPTWDFEVTTGAIGSNAGLGGEAPDFTLTGIDGKTYTLSDQRGRPVVLAYFATW